MSGAAVGTEVLQWHDASQRKPDGDITVLCWLGPGGEWYAGWWDRSRWFDAATGGALEGVTHWAEPVGPNVRAETGPTAQGET